MHLVTAAPRMVWLKYSADDWLSASSCTRWRKVMCCRTVGTVRESVLNIVSRLAKLVCDPLVCGALILFLVPLCTEASALDRL